MVISYISTCPMSGLEEGKKSFSILLFFLSCFLSLKKKKCDEKDGILLYHIYLFVIFKLPLPSKNCYLVIILQVENLTVSFSDGRALCLLLHHYYPDLLPRDLILWETTQNIATQVRGQPSQGSPSFWCKS